MVLHGLTGTPYEVRPLAESLAAHGFAVRCPLLAGHTDLASLEASTWRDWYASAETAFDTLRADGRRRVMVVGFSMGGLLALRLAALRSREVAGVVALSVPLRFEAWKRSAILTMARLRSNRFFRDLVGVLGKEGGPDVRVEREAQQSPSLEGFPYPALAELLALQDEVDDLLPFVRAPLLVMHGRYDHTAPAEHSERIAQRVSASRVERVVLPRSFHQIGLDLDRERACEEVVRFALSVLGEADRPPPRQESDAS